MYNQMNYNLIFLIYLHAISSYELLGVQLDIACCCIDKTFVMHAESMRLVETNVCHMSLIHTVGSTFIFMIFQPANGRE
jgi:hypothetical protein